MNAELLQFVEANGKFNWRPDPKNYPANLWNSDWPFVTYEKTIDPFFVQMELEKIDHLFVEHRSKDSYGHSGWSSITLHGIDYNKTEHFDRYGFTNEADANYQWTSICNQIPYITNVIKNLPFCDYGRIRIMRLAPGGFVMPHKDGNGRTFGPFNFALTNPVGCKFIFEGYGVVPFAQGRGCMLDLGIRHAVFNESDQNRYHVIVHGSPTSKFYQGMMSSIAHL